MSRVMTFQVQAILSLFTTGAMRKCGTLALEGMLDGLSTWSILGQTMSCHVPSESWDSEESDGVNVFAIFCCWFPWQHPVTDQKQSATENSFMTKRSDWKVLRHQLLKRARTYNINVLHSHKFTKSKAVEFYLSPKACNWGSIYGLTVETIEVDMC